MTTLYVTEFNGRGASYRDDGAPVPNRPAVAHQAVTFTTAAASAAFGASTEWISVRATGNCFVLVGTAPVATASGAAAEYLPSGELQSFRVQPGHKISAIDAA